MKKAQAEIIGLLVIVILFVFAGLIYLMFAGKTEEPMTRDITQLGKAQQMLDAFMQITPCYMTTPYEQMDKIIKDCYTSEGDICGQDCKELIKNTLKDLMEAYNQKQKYEFKIMEDGETFLSEGNCLTADKKVTTERLAAGTQTLTLKLTYCME